MTEYHYTFKDRIPKKDLDDLRMYREYRRMRKASGWRPRRLDDRKGIQEDLFGEWLGPPGDNLD